jgi:hypothetical protein
MLGFLDVPVRSRAETGNNPGNWDPIDMAVRGKCGGSASNMGRVLAAGPRQL